METWYECPYCSCNFFTKKDLEAHIQTFGEEPYKHKREINRIHYFDHIEKKKQHKEKERKTKLTKASEQKTQQKIT